MRSEDPRDRARTELLKNLKARKHAAGGAWFPARTSRSGDSARTEAVAPAGSAPPPLPRLVIPPGTGAPAPVTGDLFGDPAPAAAPSRLAPVIPTQGQPRPASREERIAELRLLARHAEACRRCVLGSGRRQAVFGVGNPDAELMFVGEGPGRDEDAQGEPFVGRAGQKLNSLIDKLGFKREDVYIANVVKCRPPDNRTPLPEEAAACFPYLQRQIELISPRIIIALGLPAAQTLLGLKQTMGQFRKEHYRLGGATVIATYHPAYVLRNPSAAWDVWNDVKMVPEMLRQ